MQINGEWVLFSHITGLNVAARARQHCVDGRQRLRWRHASGELFPHQPPDFLCANGPWDASRQAYAFEKAVEHEGIQRTYVRLAIGNMALVVRKRRTARMHEQVASWGEVLDGIELSPDRCHGVLHLPCLTPVPPGHTPAIPLPALAMQAGAVLTHLRKLHNVWSHIARRRGGKQ